MQTLYELPVPKSGLERQRVIRINRMVRELSVSTDAIAHELYSAIINNAVFQGEKTLDGVLIAGARLEQMTRKLRFGRDKHLRKRQRAELRATPADVKRRWATYFLHQEGGITDFLRSAEAAWKALDEYTRSLIPVEMVQNELRRMEALGLLWGGEGSYALTVDGLTFVRLYGFPHWFSRHEFWRGMIWWSGIVLGAFGVVANTYQVFGCQVL